MWPDPMRCRQMCNERKIQFSPRELQCSLVIGLGANQITQEFEFWFERAVHFRVRLFSHASSTRILANGSIPDWTCNLSYSLAGSMNLRSAASIESGGNSVFRTTVVCGSATSGALSRVSTSSGSTPRMASRINRLRRAQGIGGVRSIKVKTSRSRKGCRQSRDVPETTGSNSSKYLCQIALVKESIARGRQDCVWRETSAGP